MKRIAIAAAVLAITACGEKKEEAAPAPAAPAAEAAAPAPAADTTMKMDTSKKAAAPAADAKKDAKKP
jgi:hypothetical protein